MARILFVDDEPNIRLFYTGVLADAGHDVREAASSRETMLAIQRERPDLVILDLVLPAMDGIEALRRIREQGWGVRVVVFTAYGTADRAREALALGAREFIGKPFDLERLVQVVSEQVGRAAPRNQG